MRSVSFAHCRFQVRAGKPRAVWLGVLALVACFGAVGCDFNKKKREALAEGDRLYATNPAEAVGRYKEGFDAAGTRKAEVLQRIVDHEAKAGNAAEAKRWVEKGLNEKLNAAYETPAARELLTQVQQERAEAEAKKKEAEDKKKAEHEAKDQAKRAEKEKKERYGSYTEAMSQAEKGVRKNLPFPNDATFRALGEPVVQNPDGSWQVSGRVTTRDASGARVTYRFRGTMLRSANGSWESVGDIFLDPE